MSVIALGADHAGFALKQIIAEYLSGEGHEIVDCGTHDESRVDYPDYGAAVGMSVANRGAECGLVVCGSGIGIVMAAGKVPGIRAATVHDVTTARACREHNDANVIGIGARMVGEQTALEGNAPVHKTKRRAQTDLNPAFSAATPPRRRT